MKRLTKSIITDNTECELSIAVNDFIKSLPEAEMSVSSTFKNEVFLDHQKIILYAQKTKSKEGLCWNIHFAKSSQLTQSL